MQSNIFFLLQVAATTVNLSEDEPFVFGKKLSEPANSAEKLQHPPHGASRLIKAALAAACDVTR